MGEVAVSWLARGPSLVIVTDGENGATAFSRGKPLSIPGRRVAVVDTVGAGDTFHAATLAELDRIGRLTPEGIVALDRATLGEVLNFAAKAASITCTRRGADLPTMAEVARRGDDRPRRRLLPASTSPPRVMQTDAGGEQLRSGSRLYIKGLAW